MSGGIGRGGGKLEVKVKETPAGGGHHGKGILHWKWGHPGDAAGRGARPPGLYFSF